MKYFFINQLLNGWFFAVVSDPNFWVPLMQETPYVPPQLFIFNPILTYEAVCKWKSNKSWQKSYVFGTQATEANSI